MIACGTPVTRPGQGLRKRRRNGVLVKTPLTLPLPLTVIPLHLRNGRQMPRVRTRLHRSQRKTPMPLWQRYAARHLI